MKPACRDQERAGSTYWIATLGCPKNEVDSAKLAGRLAAKGSRPADSPEEADLIVVNTCAFIEAAREESVGTILDLAERRRSGARLAVTGCMAERYGAELEEALPEADVVAGFGVDVDSPPTGLPVTLRRRGDVPSFDLLELPRPPAVAPWAYVKVAEGCDRRCGFCAIPSFRGRQRSRTTKSILAEVESLEVSEVVLVAQDLASFGRDRGAAQRQEAHGGQPEGPQAGIVELVERVAERVPWVRLLYLYPSSLTDRLVDAVLSTGVPYFDLSLQHVSAPLLRRMRRWGDGGRYLERIRRIRDAEPEAALRSSFILGYPGETEDDHDQLLAFLEEVELDWAGFFTFSRERGTYADTLDGGLSVPGSLALERLLECAELQDSITARKRSALVGRELTVLDHGGGSARSYREAPEIDGVVRLRDTSRAASGPTSAFYRVRCTGAEGPDLIAERVVA